MQDGQVLAEVHVPVLLPDQRVVEPLRGNAPRVEEVEDRLLVGAHHLQAEHRVQPRLCEHVEQAYLDGVIALVAVFLAEEDELRAPGAIGEAPIAHRDQVAVQQRAGGEPQLGPRHVHGPGPAGRERRSQRDRLQKARGRQSQDVRAHDLVPPVLMGCSSLEC